MKLSNKEWLLEYETISFQKTKTDQIIIKTNSVPCCPLSFCTKQARIVDSNEEGLLVGYPALCAAGFPSNGDTLQLTSKCQSHNSLLNHNGTRINIKSCFTLYSPQRGLNTSSYKCSIQSWLVFYSNKRAI